jgi:tetratricopeptide (TPR) repeat protein
MAYWIEDIIQQRDAITSIIATIISIIATIIVSYYFYKKSNNRHKDLPLPQSDPKKYSIWNAPPANPNFFGRDQIVQNIRTTFLNDTSGSKIYILTGLGGVGKSQIAINYAHLHKLNYVIVWWIQSEESTVLAMNYTQLASELNLSESNDPDQPKIVHAVRSWLEKNQNWLLIFDNAQGYKQLEQYIPTKGSGHIIITSRNKQWTGIGTIIEVPPFDRKSSIEFLIKRSGREEREGAAKLAEELGDLPLALEQAGSYISQPGITLSDYLASFREHLSEIMAEGKPPDYPFTVATTWNLSFESMSDEAKKILILFSFLSPNCIPRWLLEKGSGRLSSDVKELIRDTVKFNRAISLLAQYSLITAINNEYSIHRLVQAVTIDRLKEKREPWAHNVFNMVNFLFPDNSDDVNTWPICSQLISHALTVLENASKYNINPRNQSVLLNKIGLYQKGRADYSAAKNCYIRALAINEKEYGPDHPYVAISLNNLGRVLQELGDLEEAKKNIERALVIFKKKYGPDHPDTGKLLDNIGMILFDLGDLSGARRNVEQALRIAKNISRPDDHDLSIRLNNLGRVLQASGNLQGAKKNIEQALEIDEKAYGPDHPFVAIRLDNLGLILQESGNLQEAKKNIERALAIDEKAYGSDHPDVARHLNNLGMVLFDLGDLSGAKKNIEQAIVIDEKVFGPDHPNVAIDINNFARVLQESGNLQEAKKIIERALTIDEKAYGSDHPDVARHLNNLGMVLFDLGDLSGAKKNVEQAIAIDEKVFGPNYPKLAISLNNLGRVLLELGDLDLAEKHIQRALEINESVYGPDHLQVAISLKNLGLVFQDFGDYDLAEKTIKRALIIYERVYGPDHLQVIKIRKSLFILRLKKIFKQLFRS